MINQLKKIIPSKIKQKIKLFLHKGNSYLCPFCGYSSKDLAPIGYDFPVIIEKQVIGAGKRDAGCYKCGSIDRERLVYIYLKHIMKIFNNKGKQLKILHFAPEKNLSKTILDFGFNDYTCGDLFTEGYSYPNSVKNINVLNISYNEKTFDLIICNHILEHIPNDIDAMKELFRVLKNGGKAILQVPISKNTDKTFEDFSITEPNQREIVFGQFDHIRIYGQDYSKRLSSVGFSVERFNFSGEYSQYGFNEDEDIFIAKK
ncbi:MAG: methyltransferase domain-containing protein [Sulfurovum sp.]